MARLNTHSAAEIVRESLVEENIVSIDECARMLGYHRNTIISYARESVENKRSGINDPMDFPAMQMKPRGKYKILLTDFKNWCNLMGLRI